MKYIYRFTERRFNTSLCALGILRIGTLYDFRRMEHGKGIQDQFEGTKKLFTNMTGSRVKSGRRVEMKGPDGEDMVAYLQKDVNGYEYGAVTSLEDDLKSVKNLSYSSSVNAADCYVLCFSTSCDTDVLKELEGSNSCVRIHDIKGFIETLTLAINHKVLIKRVNWMPVVYKSREEHWDGKNLGMNPAFIKGPEFSGQHEFRVVWTPKYKKELKPIFIADYKLGKYCTLVY
ncbi:hypothetical protein AOR13_572 [Alteromonas stellipolaris LMG 21856]|nr:hypothetical protein AOR13_572 [Alteromonas stellipolaris LMG 21856]